MNTSINPTQHYLFTTWVNVKADDCKVYKGSDGKLYCRRYGLGVQEITEDWAMSLAWNHINNTVGWPCHIPEGGTWINRTVSISKEEQDKQCKRLLQLTIN